MLQLLAVVGLAPLILAFGLCYSAYQIRLGMESFNQDKPFSMSESKQLVEQLKEEGETYVNLAEPEEVPEEGYPDDRPGSEALIRINEAMDARLAELMAELEQPTQTAGVLFDEDAKEIDALYQPKPKIEIAE